MKKIFITGGTGYMGRRIIPELLRSGYEVKALVRKGSEHKLPAGATAILGNALDAPSYQHQLGDSEVVIHLIGVPHPSPARKAQFISIDLESVKQLVQAVQGSSVKRIVYLSVSQADISLMKEYRLARKQGEELIKTTGLTYAFIRPWYVIGPGHYWPLLFLPLFKLMESIPATSAKAKAIRLVYLRQVISALLEAVHHPSPARIIEIDELRKYSKRDS